MNMIFKWVWTHFTMASNSYFFNHSLEREKCSCEKPRHDCARKMTVSLELGLQYYYLMIRLKLMNEWQII